MSTPEPNNYPWESQALANDAVSQVPPSTPVGPAVPSANATAKRSSWWNLPKVIVAGVLVVILAGFGGGAIGYGLGEHHASHHTFKSGQYKNGQHRNGAGGALGGVPEHKKGSGTGSSAEGNGSSSTTAP